MVFSRLPGTGESESGSSPAMSPIHLSPSRCFNKRIIEAGEIDRGLFVFVEALITHTIRFSLRQLTGNVAPDGHNVVGHVG